MIFVALINAIAKRRLKKFRTSHLQKLTLGARDFSSAVSGFCKVFIVTHAKSLWTGAPFL